MLGYDGAQGVITGLIDPHAAGILLAHLKLAFSQPGEMKRGLTVKGHMSNALHGLITPLAYIPKDLHRILISSLSGNFVTKLSISGPKQAPARKGNFF
jgi:hypothetical protein